MSIHINPLDSLVHEDVSIEVHDAAPYSIVNVELRLLHPVGTYRSYAMFKTDVTGRVYVPRDAPIRGTYTGIRGMGLFESVEPTENVRFGAYCKCTPPDNFKYELIVTDTTGKQLCSKQFIKRLIHPDVRRIEIEQFYPEQQSSQSSKTPVTGTLFKPPGNGPFPTIIDISGTGGGINEQKGAAMASRGFCVFSLAFFQYKSLPENLLDVDVQYFEDAINLVTSWPFTGDRIGFQGVSFGGTLAIYFATKFPKIKATVSINGSYAMDEIGRIREYGKEMSFVKFQPNGGSIYFLNKMMCYNKIIKNLDLSENARFKLEESSPDTAFRFVSALDDFSTATVYSTNLLYKELRKLNREVDVHYLPAGHLLDPPCYPAHPIVYAKLAGCYQAYGGETSLHGKSEFEAWESTIQFFGKHIGEPQRLRNYSMTTSKL